MRQIRRALRWASAGVMCAVAALAGIAAWAQAAPLEWQAPAADLARQIAGITGPGVVSLAVRNASTISAEQVAGVQAAIAQELGGAGVQVRAAGDVGSAVRVTLSQSAKQGLWVAEVQQGPEVRVAMVEVALPVVAATTHDAELVLRKTLVVSAAERVLDAGWAGTGASRMLMVLSPESVMLYASGATESAAPVKQATLPIQHARPLPRDVRGRLEVGAGGEWKAYLPGVVCAPAVSGEGSLPRSLTCADSDDPWPLGSHRALFNAGRNFFTGVAMPAVSADGQPFYAVAEVSEKRGGATVVSTVANGMRVVDAGASRALSGTRDWGSDVAVLQSGCGAGAQVLASAAGDGAQDSVQAYEIDRAEAVPASAPLALSGRVVAMWSGASAEDGVMVVVEKDEPRSYEVYRVTGACSL